MNPPSSLKISGKLDGEVGLYILLIYADGTLPEGACHAARCRCICTTERDAGAKGVGLAAEEETARGESLFRAAGRGGGEFDGFACAGVEEAKAEGLAARLSPYAEGIDG